MFFFLNKDQFSFGTNFFNPSKLLFNQCLFNSSLNILLSNYLLLCLFNFTHPKFCNSFRGTSGIDIDLRRVDIDQCPLPEGEKNLNIFAASDKCKKATTYVSQSLYSHCV